MSTHFVRFHVLGQLAVVPGDGVVSLPGSQVLQGLLGVLLLAQGVPLSAERLARLAWADRAQATSRESVHVGVSRLRKWLRRLDSPEAGEFTIDYVDGYLLRVPGPAVDLGRFRALTTRARTVDEPAARSRLLASALELRRGPVLAGMRNLDRSDPLVHTVEQEVREAVLALAGAAPHTEAPGAAVPAVSELAEELPFDEPLHAALIDLLAASGRPAEALRRYQRLSERLGDELGVEPSGQVQEALLRVLARDRALADEASAEVPGPVPELPVPAQLPPAIPDFTGRADETAALSEALVQPPGGRPRTVAVATIAGMGGIGKTTLAVHVAHRLSAAFPGGLLYADLHGDAETPADPGEVLGRFLRAFGMSGAGVPASLEERTALYRSRAAGRGMLVVLDNASGEDQVRPLLPGFPDASVLITSRHRLSGLEGATLLDLDVLSTVQAVDLLARIAGSGRVTAEPEAAIEIARLCGHVPLAVRIAAARLVGRPRWTLARLARVLRDEQSRLDELSVGDLAIRTGLEMSYRPLPAGARAAFRMIGLLNAPDFASWAVAALLDIPVDEAEARLEALIDAQLVNIAETDATGELRYRLHDLVRLYARERAEAEDSPGQRAAALKRVLGAWLWLAERAADHVPGPCYIAMHGSALRWPLPPATAALLLDDPLRWFTAERMALVAAAGQACELRLDELAWDLVACMEKYCQVRGLYDEWRLLHERALRLCLLNLNRKGEAVLRRGLLEMTALTTTECGGTAMVAMRDSAERLLRLFAELGDPCGMADALVSVAWGTLAQGSREQAVASADRSLRLAESAGYPAGQARAHLVMAVAHGEGDLGRAIECLERALEIAELLGNPRFRATITQFLGAAHTLARNVETAHALLNDSIAVARSIDDRFLETFSLVQLAKLLASTGDELAGPTAELALAYSRAGNFRHYHAEALGILGELSLAAGDVPGALARLTESVRIWRARGWLPLLAGTLLALGDAHAAAGDGQAARLAWAEARGLFAGFDDATGLAAARERLGANNSPLRR